MRNIKSLLSSGIQYAKENPKTVFFGAAAVGSIAYGIDAIGAWETLEAVSAADQDTFNSLISKGVESGWESLTTTEMAEFERINELLAQYGQAIGKPIAAAVGVAGFSLLALASHHKIV